MKLPAARLIPACACARRWLSGWSQEATTAQRIEFLQGADRWGGLLLALLSAVLAINLRCRAGRMKTVPT